MSLSESTPAVSIPGTAANTRPGATTRRTGSRIVARVLIAAAAYVLVTAALLVGLLMQLRDETVTASERELSAFAQLTAGHTYEIAFDLEQRLKFAEVSLSVATSSGAADQAMIGPMLQEVVKGGRALKDMLVVDAGGRVIYQAGGIDNIGLDWSGQSFFDRLRRSGAEGFVFGTPLRRAGAATNDWVLPVAHAWRRANGELAGAIVGLMDPQFFDKAWTLDSEIAGLSIALTAADGTIFMRRPFVESALGRTLIDGASSGQVLAIAGTRRAHDPLNGRLELEAYRPVAAYPQLVVFVARPMDVVLAGWRRIAWIAGSSWVAASAALALLGLWLARETKARGAVERRYHALFDSIPHPVIVSDAGTGRLLACNETAIEQYGWRPTPASAGPASDLSALSAVVAPHQFDVLASVRNALSYDRPHLIQDQQHRNVQGVLLDVELTARLIDFNGVLAILTVVVDVTERHKAEQARRAAEDQLRQSQKMDALGQLTGGIAHDFNNVLMIILSGVEEIAERTDIPDDVHKDLTRIAQSSHRAEELTRKMLAFSRQQPLRPRPTDVNELVVDTGKLLRRTLGAQVEIDSILADDLWSVDIDPSQLEISLVNLCLNAREAMPNGGHVLIETANVVKDRGEPRGEFVTITVRDTGHGILPQNLDQIFEPFFTTKTVGRGSGLGLSMVYGFVKQSNGTIEVESELDHGTVFTIRLPRHLGKASAVPMQKTKPAVGGTERILVVEDDGAVRASVVRQLRSLGYTVSEAIDGAAGRLAFESTATPFDLLLTDVIMPGPMNGKALADEVGRRWPAARIVFMSGYTASALGDGATTHELLSKPFRKADLADVVRRTLDNPSNLAPSNPGNAQ